MILFRSASRSSRKPLRQISESIGKLAASVARVDNYSSVAPAEQRLAGQVAIITGGASGIGARTARLFTEQGARVVIADIQASRAEKLVKELGPKAEFVHCDVRKEEDIIKAWDRAYSLEKRLDIVFNNAGILGALGPLYELPIEEFDATMALNLRGAVLGVKHAARLMIPAGNGSIVCTSSVAGLTGGFCAFSYSTSKGAIIAMVKCAAAELRRFGIRVNAISPDLMATPMGLDLVKAMTGDGGTFDIGGAQKIGTEAEHSTVTSAPKDETESGSMTMGTLKELIKQQSLIVGRSCSDIDVANGVLYLASDTGGYVTGHNLVIDGGRATLKLVDPESNAWATTYQPMINVAGQRGL
ncbi:unnamed protein product [Calypogeia fissa]